MKKNINKYEKCYMQYQSGNRFIIGLIMSIALLFASCKKLVEVDPPITSLTGENVYTNNATAASVLTGVYGVMGSGDVYSGRNGISMRSGLCADELTLYSGGFNGGANHQLYQNNLTSKNPILPDYWANYYQLLLTVNSAIEGLNASDKLTTAVKKQLLGEALFMRAFFHFYLVNLYGDVPLSITSDWRINATATRASKDAVYQQIIADLKEAQNLLTDKYVKADAVTIYNSGSEERIRPNKWAATALLARAYLYNKDWVNAETQSTLLINNTVMYNLNTLDAAFSKNNPEAIWQIQYTNTGSNTEGFHFILTSAPNNTRPTYLSNFLLNAFEVGDNRKTKWVKSFTSGANTWFYPFKYKVQNNPNNTEYLMVLRFAEQYLIRAEAKARQNKLSEAIADLDKIRQRANLPLIAITNPGISQGALIDKILHERQIELFTEWGHRWFDLKRTGTIDAVMTTVLPVKRPGFTWNTNWQLYPLSQSDINLNPNLAPNNPGY